MMEANCHINKPISKQHTSKITSDITRTLLSGGCKWEAALSLAMAISSQHHCQQRGNIYKFRANTFKKLPISGKLYLAYDRKNHGSAVGIAKGYSLDNRGVRVQVYTVKNFLSTLSRPALGPAQPLIQWVLGTISLGIKQEGSETDHSTLTTAQVKKT
jgi:hypothetical protein